MAQRGVSVSAAAAALGRVPAIFLRTYAHLYPGDLRSAADAMDLGRAETIGDDATSHSRPIELVASRGKRGDKSEC